MNHLRILTLLLLLIPLASANAQSAKADSKITALIAAVLKQNPGAERDYRRIQIGSTLYLVRGNSPKVIRTKKASASTDSGICQNYAYVYTVLSNAKMQDLSDGEGAIWKADGTTWKLFAASEGGGFSCGSIKSIPRRAQECLEVTECY